MFFFKKKKYLPKSPLLTDASVQRKVSFCMTHKNRFHQLEEALKKNLEDNLEDRDMVEFILMDFDDHNDTREWIKTNFQQELKDGYLKYFQNPELPKWHMSIAKNTSHLVAEGAILVSLDCDNFTGYRGGKFVLDNYLNAEHNIVLWQFSKVKQDGSHGRISLTRDLFDELGGYDEALMPAGYQDNDIMERAIAKGVQKVHRKDRDYNQTIPNDKYQPENMSYTKMKMTNKANSRKNIKNGRLLANNGDYGLKKISKLNSNGEMEPLTF